MTSIESLLVIACTVPLAVAVATTLRCIADLPAGFVRTGWALMTGAGGMLLGLCLLVAIGRPDLEELPSEVISGGLAGAALLAAAFNALAMLTARALRRSVLGGDTVVDSLTGLYDRRFVDQRLNQELSRARRYNLPLSVLRIDVDGFESINRTHGRHIGDQVLSVLGKLLADGLRAEDVAGRYGGNEFVVLAPSTELDGAAVLARRLRKAIRTFQFVAAAHTADHRPLTCTVSVGVAAFGTDTAHPDALLDAAGAALAEAKNTGCDRVVVQRGEHGHSPDRP
jgi:diguanylate cyclase (GGDEF)-like protein